MPISVLGAEIMSKKLTLHLKTYLLIVVTTINRGKVDNVERDSSIVSR